MFHPPSSGVPGQCRSRRVHGLSLLVPAMLGLAVAMAPSATAQTDPSPLLVFRADSANGSGPYASPGAASPWVDLRGAHAGTLTQFDATPASGWKGVGTPESPRRLEYAGISERVTLPGGSVSGLQSATPVTAAMWFRTSFDGPSSKVRYLLEWLDVDDRGMSIAVLNGQLRVWFDPWADVAPLAPATWYHVAVAKDTDSVRVYLNGARVYTGDDPHLGVQTTPIGIGCSTYRINDGSGSFDDFWNGAIAQVEIWQGALGDSAVSARYLADRPLYVLTPPLPVPSRVVELRADQGDGAAPWPAPGAGSPFTDLIAPPANASLLQFDGTASSGWQGSGIAGDPRRLAFDGVDDVARIAPAAVAELQSAHALTAEMWVRTGSDVLTSQYWMEWLQAFGRVMGMTLGTANGQLRVYDGAPDWVTLATVTPETWYHVAVAKEPGEMRVYLNGARVFTSNHPNFGEPANEIAIGASLYRGPGQYGEYFHGDLAQLALSAGALDDATALASWQADSVLYANHTITATAGPDGSVSPAGATLVPRHGGQSFTFTPIAGFHVADVLVDGVSVGTPADWTFADVTANHTLHVTFAPDTPIFYTITASAGPNGSVSPSGPVSVPHRGSQTFTFQPDSGYHVAQVFVDGTNQTGASYTFTDVTADHALHVTFALNVYTVTASADPSGSITPAGAVPVTHGTDQAFAVAADPGWRIRDLVVDGVSQGPLDAYAFTAVTGPHTIHAKFSPVPAVLVTLRADSALGTGPPPVPSGTSPWQELRGGHDAVLENFIATLASGWNGNGTPASPWRLEFTGHEERAVIPPVSVPELMTYDPVTATVWFQTDPDGEGDPARRYLLEWIEPGERGMAISMRQGKLGIFHDLQWLDVATLPPGAWHHVAVAKESDEVRVYVNGAHVFTAPGNYIGKQVTPIGIGTSTYRMADGLPYPYWYGDYYTGAIGAVEVWRGALLASEVQARFAADSAQYLPNPVVITPERVVHLRADLHDGVGPPAVPGAAGPWKDLAGAPNDGTLRQFAGDATGGWTGTGTPLDPYALRFDGVDDVVTLPPASVSELLPPLACSVELWMRTPADVDRQGFLIEWLESFGRSTGFSVDVADSALRVYLDDPEWAVCAPVAPDTWYHVVVTKQPGEVRAYLNGQRVLTRNTPHMGDQGTALVIGGSIWRGPGQYGDFWAGDIGEVAVWNGALSDSGAAALWTEGCSRWMAWPLTAAVGGQGTITPEGMVRVPHGGSQAYTIAPESEHELADVLVDGVSIGPVTGYTFTNVGAPHGIYARFRAVDTVAPRVQVRDPNGGDVYGAGQKHYVFWRSSDLGGVREVDVLFSIDNGANWLPIATAIRDSGVCEWMVPDLQTNLARIKVVARDTTGNMGFDVSDAPFTIGPVVLGVPDGWRLALSGFVRNPATSDLRVSFTLPDAGPARLDLLDLSGRRVRSHDVGGYGAGRHTVDLGGGERPAAGVYFLRLAHATGTRMTKAVILR